MGKTLKRDYWSPKIRPVSDVSRMIQEGRAAYFRLFSPDNNRNPIAIFSIINNGRVLYTAFKKSNFNSNSSSYTKTYKFFKSLGLENPSFVFNSLIVLMNQYDFLKGQELDYCLGQTINNSTMYVNPDLEYVVLNFILVFSDGTIYFSKPKEGNLYPFPYQKNLTPKGHYNKNYSDPEARLIKDDKLKNRNVHFAIETMKKHRETYRENKNDFFMKNSNMF